MKVTVIDGRKFRDFIIGGSESLRINKEVVDGLNVFPVPDGDTGTNMHLTLQSAVKEIEQNTNQLTLARVAQALAKGSLMGARGNSGVILSQIFRGLAQDIEQYEEATAVQVARALQSGVETAYKAVMKPVEGTMLTVIKECAKGALAKANNSDDVVVVLTAALMAGEKALAFTPEQLPVLKQAGVVDAGGKGILAILEGGIKALTGDFEYNLKADEEQVKSIEIGLSLEDLTFRYCTEFLLSGSGINLEKLQQQLENFGDSLLVVGTEELVKVHIHTDRPGLILEKSIEYGQLHEININNMVDQHSQASNNTGSSKQLAETKKIGVIAVTSGTGLIEMLVSMGVDQIVSGGQTMNPSTEDLLAAIEQVAAEQVIILPNNSNIILAAKQATELCTTKEVAIVPTKTYPQALAAMLAYNSDGDLEKVVEEMTKNLELIQSGEITYAVRNSKFNDLEIKEGEIIGLIDNEIFYAGGDKKEVASRLLEEMVTDESELITLFYGEEINEEEVNKLVDELTILFPNQEVETYNGGQKLYYYIIAVE